MVSHKENPEYSDNVLSAPRVRRLSLERTQSVLDLDTVARTPGHAALEKPGQRPREIARLPGLQIKRQPGPTPRARLPGLPVHGSSVN